MIQYSRFSEEKQWDIKNRNIRYMMFFLWFVTYVMAMTVAYVLLRFTFLRQTIMSLIQFRNEIHAMWLMTTILVFVSIIAYMPENMKLHAILLSGLLYIFISVFSFFVTKRKGNTRVFSEDCIWFNGIVAGVYTALALYITM